MPDRSERWPDGVPAWADLSVRDIDRSKAFYTQVLGWDYASGGDESGGYLNATVDGRAVAGLAPPMSWQLEAPHVWTVYLAVSDAARTESAIREEGGAVVQPTTQIGTAGTMGVYADPTGAVFGTWQAGDHNGFGRTDEAGAVGWAEAMTGHFDNAKKFYTTVFGWTYEDMSDSAQKYAAFRAPDEQRPSSGGIGEVDTSAAEQPYWSVVFGVDDTDAAARRITEAGGRVTTEPFDFEFGRLALATGPDGESFAVIGPLAGIAQS